MSAVDGNSRQGIEIKLPAKLSGGMKAVQRVWQLKWTATGMRMETDMPSRMPGKNRYFFASSRAASPKPSLAVDSSLTVQSDSSPYELIVQVSSALPSIEFARAVRGQAAKTSSSDGSLTASGSRMSTP